MFTLAISCLTTSYLPWFTDLTFQVPVQYCSLEHWTLFLSRVTSTTGYSFCLALTLHSFWVISPLISSSILGTYLSVEFIFQFPISLPFHTVHGVLKARVLKWFAIPFFNYHILLELSTMTHLSWVALHNMAHSFIELDKAVVHVSRLVSFLWLWFLSVCPLMPSLSTSCLTGISMTLDVGYLLTAPAPEFGWGGIFSQSLLLTLDVGYLLTAHIPDLVCGLSLLAAPVPHSCWSVICKLEPWLYLSRFLWK